MLGDRVREERHKRDMSLSKLSQLTGLNQSTLNRIEMNHSSPRYDTILKIAKAFDIPPHALIKPQGGSNENNHRAHA